MFNDMKKEYVRRLRKIVLRSADSLPDHVAEYIKNVGQHGSHNAADQVLDEYFPLAKHLTANYVNYAIDQLTYKPQQREDGTSLLDDEDVEHFGVRGDLKFFPPSPLQGPFFAVLGENEDQGLRLIHTLVNTATGRWKVRAQAPYFDGAAMTPLPVRVVTLSGVRELWGSMQVYAWFRPTYIDAGGGSLNDLNWLLKRGYQIHSKDCSVQRAAGIAPTVKEWFNDPLHPGRQVGWATCGSHDYEREVRRLIVRWRKRNGQECFAATLSTLSPRQVFSLLDGSAKPLNDRRAVALAYAYLYDKRGGTIEIEFKEDKQGFGLTKRNKKRYEAQQMVVLLSALAHNVVVWSREWLATSVSKIKRYGVLRIVRDVFAVSGFLEIGAKESIKRIVLSVAAAWARRCAKSLRAMLKQQHVRVTLGETYSGSHMNATFFVLVKSLHSGRLCDEHANAVVASE